MQSVAGIILCLDDYYQRKWQTFAVDRKTEQTQRLIDIDEYDDRQQENEGWNSVVQRLRVL